MDIGYDLLRVFEQWGFAAYGGVLVAGGRIKKIFQKSPQPASDPEPITAMARMALLSCFPENTKVSLHKDRVTYQPSSVTQWYARWCRGDSRADFVNLISAAFDAGIIYNSHFNKRSPGAKKAIEEIFRKAKIGFDVLSRHPDYKGDQSGKAFRLCKQLIDLKLAKEPERKVLSEISSDAIEKQKKIVDASISIWTDETIQSVLTYLKKCEEAREAGFYDLAIAFSTMLDGHDRQYLKFIEPENAATKESAAASSSSSSNSSNSPSSSSSAPVAALSSLSLGAPSSSLVAKKSTPSSSPEPTTEIPDSDSDPDNVEDNPFEFVEGGGAATEPATPPTD